MAWKIDSQSAPDWSCARGAGSWDFTQWTRSFQKQKPWLAREALDSDAEVSSAEENKTQGDSQIAKPDARPNQKQISGHRNTDTPYYTTYPPGGAWENDYSKVGFYRELDALKVADNKDAAVYVHVPFCEKLCYFCFCYTKIVKDKNKPQVLQTIAAIDEEIKLYDRAFGDREKPLVRQLQWGGGTPNYLSEQQFNQLMGSLKNAFSMDLLEEFALEVDPRTVSTRDIQNLNALGVNRISMGIQDFNPQVQEAINRVQPLDIILELIETVDDGTSLNFDLIYGLPHQTVSTFRKPSTPA